MQRIRNLIMISSTCLLAALAGRDVNAADDDSAKVRPAQDSGERAEEQTPAGEQKQSAAAAAREAGLDRYGSEQIKQLQRELAARGAYQGRVDGVAGPMTVAALRNFQIQQKLDTSDGLNAETRDALGLNWERVEVSGRDTSSTETAPARGTDTSTSPGRSNVTGAQPSGAVQPGVSVQRPEPKVMPSPNTLELRSLDGEQARRVQQRLRDLGYYNGAVDGVLGDQSRSALQRLFSDQAALAARGLVSGAMLGWLGEEPPASEAR